MREGLLKASAFAALRFSGALGLAERARRGVPILAYHGVTGQPAASLGNHRRIHVPRALFERHLQWLREHREPIPLSALAQALARRGRLPRRAAVVTFDDGYHNVLAQALPSLRAYGVPATLFVVTGDGRRPFWQDRLEAMFRATTRASIDGHAGPLPLSTDEGKARAIDAMMSALDLLPPPEREAALERLVEALQARNAAPDEDARRLTWDEVRALRDGGLEIGSHADAHEPLTRRPPAEMRAALRESHATLVRELGPGAYALSYPYGAVDRDVAAAARDAGFACALSTLPSLARRGADPFDLPRVLVGADDDLTRLRASLAGLRGLWSRSPRPPS